MAGFVPGMLNDLALIYSHVGELHLAEVALRMAIDLDNMFLGASEIVFILLDYLFPFFVLLFFSNFETFMYLVVNLAGVLTSAGRASDPEVDNLYKQALSLSTDRTMER